MRLAVEESAGALGVSSPNPPVGAVIVSSNGEVVAAGQAAAERCGTLLASIVAKI